MLSRGLAKTNDMGMDGKSQKESVLSVQIDVGLKRLKFIRFFDTGKDKWFIAYNCDTVIY